MPVQNVPFLINYSMLRKIELFEAYSEPKLQESKREIGFLPKGAVTTDLGSK